MSRLHVLFTLRGRTISNSQTTIAGGRDGNSASTEAALAGIWRSSQHSMGSAPFRVFLLFSTAPTAAVPPLADLAAIRYTPRSTIAHPAPTAMVFQIVCYALNDLKGHLPLDCFIALSRTASWRRLMKAWRRQQRRNPSDREAFRALLRQPPKPR